MTISSDKEKQKACWEGKMKELMAEANRGSGSGSGSSMDVCAIALNAMRDMMKGVKNLKDISAAKKMDMGNMMSHLAKCTSYELKVGLSNAKLLCGSGKSSGYGSGESSGYGSGKSSGYGSGYGSGSRGHE